MLHSHGGIGIDWRLLNASQIAHEGRVRAGKMHISPRGLQNSECWSHEQFTDGSMSILMVEKRTNFAGKIKL